jgi:hypothetical protein
MHKASGSTSILPKYDSAELEPSMIGVGAPFCRAVEVISVIVVLETKKTLRDELNISTAMIYRHSF